MNETISKYWNKVTPYLDRFSRKQKILIGAILLLAMLTAALLIYQLSKTEYALAYTDLNAADAAALQSYLEEAAIPYKLSSDGRSVAVPTTKVTEVKIGVESQNLLTNGSIGYGLFRENISSFGMTDSQFELLSIDARAGEIQQLINAIDGVRESKVLLNLPSESVFVRENMGQASASVVVHFKPGYTIDQNKIDTMYNLVSKSVENLPEENITISDQNGELLPSSRLNGDTVTSTSLVTQQMQIKKHYEAEVQRNIQNFLGRILGQDKVVVNVWSTLNFDQKRREEKIYTPVNEVDRTGIERSVQEIQKSYTSNTGNVPGGIVGTGNSDIPGYQSADNDGLSTSEEVERIINYEVNEITSSIVSSPYVVQDLTVFVGIEPPVAENPDSLTEDTKAEIHRMLVNIVSASLVDSDKNFTRPEIEEKVSVLTHSFRTETGVFGGSEENNYLFYGLAALAIALILGGGYMVIRRKRRQDMEELSMVEEYEEELDLQEPSNENYMKKQLDKIAKENPDEFVNLLRTWLSEE